jgi:hypothetical protein
MLLRMEVRLVNLAMQGIINPQLVLRLVFHAIWALQLLAVDNLHAQSAHLAHTPMRLL